MAGARIAIRNYQDVAKFIKLPVDRHIFVTDSQTVLKMFLKSSMCFDMAAGVTIDKVQIQCNPLTDFFLDGVEMDKLTDKGTKLCLSPHKKLDKNYFTGRPFNQPAKLRPITPTIEFLMKELQSLPLLNLYLDFIEKSEQLSDVGEASGLNLMQLADKLPVKQKQPPFWKLMARYRTFNTSVQYLISLSRVLVKIFPQYYPEFVDKNRMECYDLIVEKLLKENPVSDTVT